MVNSSDWKIKYQDPDTNIPLLQRIKKSRGYDPDLESDGPGEIHDPFLINDMDIAVMEIDSAINSGKKILIYGDYDVDGATATTIIVKFLRRIGVECDYYIPDRLKDGYGMSEKGIRLAIDGGYGMVITVDCGITAVSYVKKLKNSGISVIITDHHECKEKLPDADAVIDCWRKDNTYPFQPLCGAGVALKLVQALCMELDLGDIWEDYTMYAALGTVADVMPLTGENRTIVQKGLKQIKSTNDIGIRNLLAVAGKLEDIHSLKATDIAFYLGPLINASSRIRDVSVAMGVFLSEDQNISYEYALELQELNNERKKIEESILKEAYVWLFENFDFSSYSPIAVCGKNWHKGVIGIVAAKLADVFCRPVIMLSETDGIYSGSCRTFGDINIMDILNYASGYIDSYGGHKEAAGLHVDPSKLDGFLDKIKEYGNLNFNEDSFYFAKEAEMVIKASDITLDNAIDLATLEPFGQGNPRPMFVCQDLKISTLKKIGRKAGAENAHLKMVLSDRADRLRVYDGIGFFMSDYCDMVPPGRNVDVLFSIGINEWQNKKNVQLEIKDIHFDHAFGEGLTVEESDLFSDGIINIGDIMERTGVSREDLLPSRDDYMAVFNCFRTLFSEPGNSTILTSLDILSIILTTRTNMQMNPFKLDRILECFDEAGFVYYRKLFHDKITLMPSPGRKKKKFAETSVFKRNHEILKKEDL